MATSYSAEQEKVVLHVFKYKPHEYYQILSCEKTSSEGEIKKSYRKLAIKLHPDKNPHPRSAEAFKIVNKAWEVLSDPQKKTIYDQTGVDPDSRFAQASSGAGSPFGGGGGGFPATSPFAGFQGGGRPFDDDIFNLFFGGGPSQTFTFGNGGFQFQTFGGGDPFMRQRRSQFQQHQQHQHQQQARGGASRRNGQQQEPSLIESLKQLVPILLLLFAIVLSAIFSDSDEIPNYSFTKTRSFSTKRTTPNYKIPYFVEKSFDKKAYTSKQLKKFDLKIENIYIQDKRNKCSREQLLRNQMIDDAQGWFSTDQEKLRKAQKLPMPNCQALQDLNLL